MADMQIVWDLEDDPAGNYWHIVVEGHGVTQEEAEEVLLNPANPIVISRTTGSTMKFGWTTTGKHVRVMADIAGRRCASGAHETYPAGLAADGSRTYIADGNSGDMLMLQGANLRSLGTVSDAVPLSVAIGPDGAVYAGVCSCSGTGKVVRFVSGKPPAVVADGLGWVTGIAFGPDGTLYVADEHFDESDPTAAHGEVLRVGKNGAVTAVVPQGRLEWPGHLVTGPDGALYVVNHAQWAAAGEILRIKL